MARHLDLEEQEQLDSLKHFWNKWGNLITWAMIVVFGSIAAWNGWQWWQRNQAAQASGLYDELERAVQVADTARVERAAGDIREKFGRTAYAAQGALVAAKALQDAGKTDAAKSQLAWVAANGSDDGIRATGRLRLAAILTEAKAYDDALAQLKAEFPPAFAGLAADRRGDVLSLQGKRADAKAQYLDAWQRLEDRLEYRRIVEVKLNALGVDPKPTAGTPQGAAGAAK